MSFPKSDNRKSLGRFCRDESGGVTALMLPMFLLLVVATGLAIDLVRHEAHRADLQNALDRGVLAAAALSQTQDVEETVRQYVDTRVFRKAPRFDDGLPVETVRLQFSGSNNVDQVGRRIAVAANEDFDTAFIGLVGPRILNVPALSEALEGSNWVEVSLALDISGSMAREPATDLNGLPSTRLEAMRQASSAFVDGLLDSNVGGITSISLVPYAGHVNAGPLFAPLFDPSTVPAAVAASQQEVESAEEDSEETDETAETNGGNGGFVDGGDNETIVAPVRLHNLSSCIEFEDADFQTLDLPPANSRGQVPHFQNFAFEGFSGNEANWGWCPTTNVDPVTGADEDLSILPFSGDAEALKRRIRSFTGHDGTGGDMAIKWGLGLLAPSTQPLISDLATQGIVEQRFSDRPGPLDNAAVEKFLIIMSDGRIRYQNRPLGSAYDTQEEIDEWAQVDDDLRLLSVDRRPLTELGQNASTQQLINNLNADEADRQDNFLELCHLALEQGITVFTIGFGFSPGESGAARAEEVLRGCVSTVDADGITIGDPARYFAAPDASALLAAFDNITVQVASLKLAR